MFSSNQKISIRQIRRLLILDLFGLGSLLLPALLAKKAGPDGIFCIMAAFALGCLYIWILGKVLVGMQGDFCQYLRQRLGIVLSDILMVFYLFVFLLTAAFVLYQLTAMIRAWLLPEGPYPWVSLLLMLLVAYAAIRGLEGRARIYEILFWFLLAPLLLMLALAARDVNVGYWAPVFFASPGSFWQGTAVVCAFFLPVCFVLFLKPYCASPRKLRACAMQSLGIAAACIGALYLILLGNFGTKSLASLRRPAITLMSMVKLPGGFFARMDAFMTAIWFFSLFALMNTGVFYAGHILKELFQLGRAEAVPGQQKHSAGVPAHDKAGCSLWAVLVGVYVAGQWFFRYGEAVELFSGFALRGMLPALVAIPALLWILECVRKRGEKHA